VRAAVNRLSRAGARARARRGEVPFRPTYFEVLTAVALLQARAARVTAAVFEIGLGGRYDATNVIPAPVAVITGIDRDHTEYLGKSLKKIAWNKAGIIKKDQNVFTLESRTELLTVFRQECRRRGATLVQVPGRCARRRQADVWDLDLRLAQRVSGSDRLPGRLAGVRLGLRGPHQGPQAVLALAAAGNLLAVTGGVGPPAMKALRMALAGVHLPGRLECRQMSHRRLLVTDAAHNPAAAALLAGEIRAMAQGRPVTLLFGALTDKDAGAMILPFLDLVDTVKLTSIRHHRGMKIKDLNALSRNIFGKGRTSAGTADRPGSHKVFDDPGAAWTAARAATPPGGILLVAGSFYLLGDLWSDIKRRPLIR
jgi:dihydrofolate synthase/folylpolyglutamate synthase